MAGLPSFAQGAVIERLAPHHDRSSFVCSDPTFAEWLQRNARQFHERGNARVWIWTDSSDTSRVLGYFTISPTEILKEEVPLPAAGSVRELMRIPSLLIGKLAKHRDLPSGAGKFLLAMASRVAVDVSDRGGGRYLIVDAINPKVAKFYTDNGFNAARVPEGNEPTDTVRLLMNLEDIRERIASG